MEGPRVICCQQGIKMCFFILQLRRSHVKQKILWLVYFALVRSILTYAYPSFCGISQTLFNRMQFIERRVEKIIGTPPPIKLSSFCESLCERLAASVNSCGTHPLRQLFTTHRNPTHSLRRHTSTLHPTVAKTTRLHISFIRYFR